jgi:hypothetical protein
MDKKVGKKLRKHFEEQLIKRLPQFHSISDSNVPPGSRAFEWKMNENLCSYIILFISPKHTSGDKFTIDVAWSTKCRFPSPRPCMNPFRNSRADPPQDGEYYARIGFLGEPFRDYWWTVTNRQEESDRLEFGEYCDKWIFTKTSPLVVDYVEDRVKEAIDRIFRDAIPWLESVAKEYPSTALS